MLVFIMNARSRGNVTLDPSNPSDYPIIVPKLCCHPYDFRVMIEAI
jgi:hypothetical protein